MKKLILSLRILLSVLLFGCSEGALDSSSDSTGQGGSLARFTINKNHLYTVGWENLQIFNIQQPENPVQVNEKPIGFGIETIHSRDSLLFFGTQWGMYIYGVSDPANPGKISYFEHIYSCDPVVVDEKYAYVTLSVDSWCGRNTNELQIVDISNPSIPELVKKYPMEKPKGLGIDENLLFLCDEGLKVFDVTDVTNIKRTHYFDISAKDVIPYNDLLIVIGEDGINQYEYSGDTITWLSEISINN